jgi:uncharacterized membrane protein SpoIIM required for sporulation
VTYLVALVLSPSGMMENLAYIIALAASLMWGFSLYDFFKKRLTIVQLSKQMLRETVKGFSYATALLFLSALLEIFNIAGVIR